MMKRQRIMVIIWPWEDRELEQEGRWGVAGTETDRLYCLREVRDLDAIIQEIDHLLKTLTLEHLDCFVFIHRRPRADRLRVFNELAARFPFSRDDTNSLKCFHFGFAADFIYCHQQPYGLLGSRRLGGQFTINGQQEYRQVIEDEDRRLIRFRNFDTVWRHYQSQLAEKLEALERHLFSYLVRFSYLEYQDPEPDVSFFEEIEKQPELEARIKSLMGEKLTDEEYDGLLAYEIQTNSHVIFNDIENEIRSYDQEEIRLHYEALQADIRDHLWGMGAMKTPRASPVEVLLALRKKFTSLRLSLKNQSDL